MDHGPGFGRLNLESCFKASWSATIRSDDSTRRSPHARALARVRVSRLTSTQPRSDDNRTRYGGHEYALPRTALTDAGQLSIHTAVESLPSITSRLLGGIFLIRSPLLHHHRLIKVVLLQYQPATSDATLSSTRSLIGTVSSNSSIVMDNGKAPAPQAAGFKSSNGAGGPGAANNNLLKVQPPRREDLQPAYAQTLQGESEDAATHGWYGSMSKLLSLTLACSR